MASLVNVANTFKEQAITHWNSACIKLVGYFLLVITWVKKLIGAFPFWSNLKKSTTRENGLCKIDHILNTDDIMNDAPCIIAPDHNITQKKATIGIKHIPGEMLKFIAEEEEKFAVFIYTLAMMSEILKNMENSSY